MSQINPTVSAIGSGVATYGKIQAVIGTILAVLIVGVLVYFGFDRLKDKHTSSADGTIASVNSPGCTPDNSNQNIVTYSCPVSISYTVDGKSYTISQTLIQTKQAVVNDKVVIRYDPSNPAEGLVEFPPKTMGYVFLGSAALILLFTIVNTTLVFKSDAYATVTGGAAIAGLIRRV